MFKKIKTWYKNRKLRQAFEHFKSGYCYAWNYLNLSTSEENYRNRAEYIEKSVDMSSSMGDQDEFDRGAYRALLDFKPSLQLTIGGASFVAHDGVKGKVYTQDVLTWH